MKKQLFTGLIAAAILSSTACTTERVVEVRPEPPVVERPVAPPGEHIYVEYEYKWRGGKYVAVPGYYVKKKPGRTWIPGKWEQKPRGYVWIPGHWK